ncbi:hypothetical protein DCO58_08985 [Helicobacter saguini]|uniref:Uncharacterized protein n=1 Tax=Helicobacter saguini TaxID=1548018 RepID=A0A347VP18_9HELI|nr:hypothetical protein [Helicobacter saguini]MWV61546.1 hypothetical protein [Helicobacter saguini]MWV67784.1 hypothetical protein [Helicobacter saguini]MWV70748.1 hypothetical protein [Helicobacter saguini]MWV72652.1 hypothetical protein [Helicobacter saguini]TLD94543.1 hypothetical protein LS64_005085 [Helicobacter saguini]
MTLTIENVNEKFLNVYKALAKSTDSKLKVSKKKKKNAVQQALEEIERGEVVRYSSFEEFKKDMLQ